MKYTGAYSSETTYEVGDIAIYTDGIPYWLQKPAPVGTGCYETLYWQRVGSPIAEAIIALHPILQTVSSALSAVSAESAATKNVVDSMLFDSKTLVLASSTASSEKTFAVTVDDDGEVSATEITEEAEEAAEGGES